MPSLLGSIPAFKGVKPEVPQFTPIDTQKETAKAIDVNLANLPQAGKLATETTSLNADNINLMLSKAIPGYADMAQKMSGLIGSQLSGEIPKDVMDKIMQSVASRGVAGGFSGSGFGRNLEAKDLGLTSLQITQHGMDSAGRWMQAADSIFSKGFFNAANMFISPEQQLNVAIQDRDKAFGRNWLAAQIKAAPSPSMKAFGETLDFLADTFIPVAAGAAGGGGGVGKGMMGGGGGGAGGGGGGGMGGAGGFGGGSEMSQMYMANQY